MQIDQIMLIHQFRSNTQACGQLIAFTVIKNNVDYERQVMKTSTCFELIYLT